MKTFLAVVGAVSLVLYATVGILFAYTMYAGAKLDRSSKAYIDTQVPLIVSNWSGDALVHDSSPRLMKTTSAGQIDNLFQQCISRFGPMVTYDGCQGRSLTNYNFRRGPGEPFYAVTAEYTAHATFQRAQANFQLKLILENGDWKFLTFHFDLAPGR